LADLSNLKKLQKTLGIAFRDISILQQALVHRSFIHENPEFELPDNERLEFLGDSLLGFVIAMKVYEDSPGFSEGEMTKLRAALVRKETLARLASFLGLGDFLYVGRGEEASGGRYKQSILAGAFEAIVGAVLIDQGFDICRDFIYRIFEGELNKVGEKRFTADYKSQLQEFVQSKNRVVPVYRTVKTVGPDHAKEFTVEVSVDGVVIGSGRGKSKRQAEKEAARAALESLSQE
jgi:ribonuclease-3